MKILLIEDEHKIAGSIKKGLEQEAYVVDVAYDGVSGMDLALGEEYDIIILDRMLPEKDGLEICRVIREKGIHTPVLMLTAKDQLHDKIEGLNTGADDYVSKPFAFEELLARVRALTRRPQITVSQILKVGDLTLDTITYDVVRNGKQIQLSTKEFALLEYLMRHPNRTLSKEQIINHVWDYDANVLPNTVEVYIGYLRNKVDKAQKLPLIHTIRGFGYRLGEKT